MSEINYKLIDCGDGRRLENFAGVLCNRPAPMVTWRKKLPVAVWDKADLYFDEINKEWRGVIPDEWIVDYGLVRFKLETASNGQVGVFSEQYENWKWLDAVIRTSSSQVNVLNCFAHTGGSSIAAAGAGATVCHLDAAKSANTRARVNADYSGCAPETMRWITEDALKYMEREVKRGNSYDAVILDPPAFGRMKKKIWKFEKDMPELLALAAELLSDNPLFFLLTSHNTGWEASDQLKFVRNCAPRLLSGRYAAGDMCIAGEGNSLPLGVFLRVEYRV